MRVAIIAGPYASVPPKQYGGSEQVIYYLIKGLKEAGHEPILLGPANSAADCELITTIDRPIGFPRTRAQISLANRRIAAYKRRTHNNLEKLLPRVDIIHSHGFDLTGYENFPNITTIHNSITFETVEYINQHPKLNFVAVSENQKKAATSLSLQGVVYNGEDPTDFKYRARPQNYVCFLGRMDTDKSPHMAIQLALQLRLKIKLAGKIDRFGRDYFRKEIRPYLNNPLVEYLGEVDFIQKIELLSKARCNFHPTNFREPFGLTIIEAGLVGTPTLAIGRGAIPELIEDGKTGIVVEDFIEAAPLVERCFEMNREHISKSFTKQFSHKRMAKNYIKVYRTAIRKARQ